jgi:hypothetical protein
MNTKCWSDNTLRKIPPLERLGQKKENNIKMDLSDTVHEEVNWNVLD